jgi:hypothetical protein
MSNKTNAVVQDRYINLIGTEDECKAFVERHKKGKVINCPGSVFDEADQLETRPNCAVVDNDHDCVILFLNETQAEALAIRLNALGMEDNRYQVLRVNIYWPIHFQLVRTNAQQIAKELLDSTRSGCKPDPIDNREALKILVETYMLMTPVPEVYFHTKMNTYTVQEMRKYLAHDGDPFPR